MKDGFLSRLVPSLENCKKIPGGKFPNTLFHWVESYDNICHEYVFIVRERKVTLLEEYPAPTVDEILKDLPMISVGYDAGSYIVEYGVGEESHMWEGISFPDVLLEAWMYLRMSKEQ